MLEILLGMRGYELGVNKGAALCREIASAAGVEPSQVALRFLGETLVITGGDPRIRPEPVAYVILFEGRTAEGKAKIARVLFNNLELPGGVIFIEIGPEDFYPPQGRFV